MASMIARRAFSTSARRLAQADPSLKAETKRNPELYVRHILLLPGPSPPPPTTPPTRPPSRPRKCLVVRNRMLIRACDRSWVVSCAPLSVVLVSTLVRPHPPECSETRGSNPSRRLIYHLASPLQAEPPLPPPLRPPSALLASPCLGRAALQRANTDTTPVATRRMPPRTPPAPSTLSSFPMSTCPRYVTGLPWRRRQAHPADHTPLQHLHDKYNKWGKDGY